MKKRGIVFFIVKRYLRIDPDQPFISIAAALAFLGVSIGVMVLIVAMAIMNGKMEEFREKLSVMNYPITILPYRGEYIDIELADRLKSEFEQIKTSPYLQVGAMSRNGSLMEGNIVFGVDFLLESAINPVFKQAIGKARYKPFDAIAGKTLVDKLGLSENKKLLMIFTKAQPSGLALTPIMKRFNIAGTFESGLHAYDKAYFYTQISDLRAILGADIEQIHGIHIDVPNPIDEIERIRRLVAPQAIAVGWWEQNMNFFSAMELEKRALFLVLMLIILVAALNIISSLMMTVLNRRRDIALLISLGASIREIEKIFFLLGAIIGVGGILLGSALGGAAMWALTNFDIISLPADVYGTSRLPLKLSVFDFSMIVSGAFAIVLLSSWYPARKAGKTDALETLRHE
ncbi:MAG: ABC transporter permease [Helicobacteraceae bacterium]|jgi:putative ABC transport system permease protein|nr:ABC transporter permease [Helicobacteraceae bacterium]